MTGHCLGFLQHRHSELYELYVRAERFAHEDPASTCVKLREFAEEMTSVVLEHHGQRLPRNLGDGLKRVGQLGAVPPEIPAKLDELRQVGNRGAHARAGERPDTTQAVRALSSAHAIATWLARDLLGVGRSELAAFQQPAPEASLAMFRDAIMTDDSDARYQVGLVLLHRCEQELKDDPLTGWFGAADAFADAARWLREAEHGVPAARARIARLIQQKRIKPAYDGERLYQLELASDRGDPDAHAQLGAAYLVGDESLPIDHAKAIEHLEAAAAGDHLEALNGLAAMFAEGAGVARDPIRAFGYARRAAEAGYPFAQHNLAVLLLRGDHGEPPDPAAAFTWFERAAKGGSADAMMALSRCLRDATGTAPDLVASREWRRRAAAGGSALGLFAMGDAHETGDGVARSAVDAADYYGRAASIPAAGSLAELAAAARTRARTLILQVRQELIARKEYPEAEFNDRLMAVLSCDEAGDPIPDFLGRFIDEVGKRGGLAASPDAFFDAIAQVSPFAARFFAQVFADVQPVLRLQMRALGAGPRPLASAPVTPPRRKAGPNDLCPCGSGRKQKKCHPGRRR